jgi:DNA-binding transcriptional LysR family regulator
MEISHLRYFFHVAQTGSFSAGARLAHVSAPAMTKAIQRLESDTGVRLFERTTRRVILTEEGKTVFQRARDILNHVDDIARDLDELRNEVSGELRIGAMEVFSIRVLPRAISALVAQFPKVVPLSYEMHPEAMQRYLAEGLLDIGFTIGSGPSDEVDSEVLGTSPGRIVCGRSHPLYRGGRVNRAALSQYPFVIPRFFQREHLPPLDQFPENRVTRRVGATIELLQMMVELVIAGTYLGCFPEISVAHHLANKDLRTLHGLPGLFPPFELRVMTKKGVTAKRSARELVRVIKATLVATPRPAR